MSPSEDATAPAASEPAHLFVYGTLGPAHARERWFEWEKDAVRGWLHDLGPYPGLVGLNDPNAPWVTGHVRATSLEELRDRLDPYEGVDQRLFGRERTRTRSGRLVWVYVYARAVPPGGGSLIERWKPDASRQVYTGL